MPRGGLQFRRPLLPASEQFQIGGAWHREGFSEGLLSGRSGYFGSVELRLAQSLAEYIAEIAMPPLAAVDRLRRPRRCCPYRPGIPGKSAAMTFSPAPAWACCSSSAAKPSAASASPSRSATRRGPRPPACAHVSVSIALDAGLARRFALEKPWISRPGIRLRHGQRSDERRAPTAALDPGCAGATNRYPIPCPKRRHHRPTRQTAKTELAVAFLCSVGGARGRREFTRKA